MTREMSSKSGATKNKPVARVARRSAGRSKTAGSGTTPTAGGRLPIVGLGASAGGLEALRTFFGAMPPKTGLSFVVVVHLDPTHESLMPELLAKSTTLGVHQAQDRQPLEADHVYIIPPNRSLAIDQGLIRVREVADRRGLRGAIDHFFRSLADDQHDDAIAIILSGTGTEGTLGLRAVKAEGGMVMAQDPDTASQSGMPTSAIATGLVDFVLSPEQMPKALLEFVQHTRIDRAATPVSPDANPLKGLHAILAVLRARTKYDFRGYKKGTLQRRVARRMGLQHITSLGAYVEFLRGHPAEADQLFKDLLIGVTSFFRDPPAFEELATKVLAALVKQADAETPIRIWVPGCSTGEEAYSIAIVAAEQVAAAQSACRVQVFATDIDDDALEIARGGVYPESIALDVTPERLKRFFTRDDHRYTIATSIRESVTFAVQNVISDPPFSKLDLVSCRNVLIYLEPSVQEHVMAVFHFALKPGGYLFLGHAESIGPHEEWFSPVSQRTRIFRRLATAKRPALEFPRPQPASGCGCGSSRCEADARVKGGDTRAPRLAGALRPGRRRRQRQGQIAHVFGAMDRYIHLPTGEATLDVLSLARDPLKPALRAAFHDAVRRGRETVLDTIHKKRGRHRTSLRITVRPLDGPRAAERLWLMIFEERPLPAGPAATRAKGTTQELVRRLETELRATKRAQQHLIAQLEHSNEELKAAHEEVLSMNEELQSTNEELVTSKEELQSMNEELTTLNSQLQEKVQEVSAVNDDLANLLVSTDIATVFVDTELRIKRFTTAATQLLNLLPSDIGRPIDHVAANVGSINMSRDARAVLKSHQPIEKEMTAEDGKHYIVRVLPYRSEGDIVQGVVITLSDVTTLKKTEEGLIDATERVSADLRRMTRLHKVSTRLAGQGDVTSLLNEIVAAAIEITSAVMGTIQVVDDTGGLTIAAQTGFEAPFLDFFKRVDASTDSAYGAVLTSRRRVIVDEVTQDSVFGNSPSLKVLMAAGVRGVQLTPLVSPAGELVGMFSTYYRTSPHLEEADLQWLDLMARQAADLLERRRREDVRTKTSDELERRVTERTKWLTLMHDVGRAIDEAPNWSEALHLVIRRVCESEGWQVGYVYLPASDAPDQLVAAVGYLSDERLLPFHAASHQTRHARGHSLPGRVFEDGHHVWVNDQEELLRLLPVRAAVATAVGLRAAVALPVRVGNETLAVVELCSDRPHPEGEELVNLMRDVSTQVGRVIERERIMAQVGEIIWGEQQNLVHTLHDALGQQLTGLGMLAASLNQRLKATDPESAQTAQQIASAAQEALERVRQLSRGLFPADIDGEGFLAALQQLAATTESLHKIPCSVTCETPIVIDNSRVATQLYRIAQEAVTNALRHAEAEHITIRLHAEGGTTTLMVSDDGVGIHHRVPNENGIGLRIMRHRAMSMGAVLSAGPGADGGTVVTCTLPQAAHVES
jgi:chemotaxis methyl-accepting protein methylase/signal transduction histidine kinase/PAS domain-containing protein